MIKHLPEWIMKRYAKLWHRFRDREFTKEQASDVLKSDKSLAVFLSDLRKAGWVSIKLNEGDARKTIYKLKDPQEAIMELVKELSNGKKNNH